MKLTLESVEGYDNKFTLEIEGIESVSDALNMQRAICRSAVEYTRKLCGAPNIIASILMEMKVLLEEEDLLELEQNGDPAADFIRLAPPELKGAEVFINVKQFIPDEIITSSIDKRKKIKQFVQSLEEKGIKDDFFNILSGEQ